MRLGTTDLFAMKRIEKFAVLQSQTHLTMIWIERKIMSACQSPFLCNLNFAFQNDTELFMVMPFMQGGDLRYHLNERGTMDVNTAKFYAAEILLGLHDLHSKNIVYRYDLSKSCPHFPLCARHGISTHSIFFLLYLDLYLYLVLFFCDDGTMLCFLVLLSDMKPENILLDDQGVIS